MRALVLKPLLRLAAAVLLAAVLAAPIPARAEDDMSAAQAIIRSQVDAFKRDDAAGAYACASPLIHELFPQADLFMGMVQTGYPPVYRHKRFEFGPATTTPDGKITQRASIVDTDDVAWEALYTLERQDDGSLKISGCMLLKVGTAV